DASDVPADYAGQLSSFAAVASRSGIRSDIAQRLVDAYVSASIDHGYDRELTSQLSMTDDASGEQTDTARENAAHYLRGRWQGDYERRMTVVRNTVNKLGGTFKAYLDSTGLGNSPGAIEAIYLYGGGLLTLSKAEAQQRLDKIMNDPRHEYWGVKGGQSSSERQRIVSEVRTLSAIANADENKPRTMSYTPAEREARANERFAADKATSARAEIAKLLDARTGISSMRVGSPERAAAVETFHKLAAQVRGGRG